MKLDQREFLIQHLTEDKSYGEIEATYNVPRKTLTEWWNTGVGIRTEIKRSNTLFNSRVEKESFSEFCKMKKRGFYEWYTAQPKKCDYCGIEEEKLKNLFGGDEPILNTKRNRGRVLELERRETKNGNNLYSVKNCVLVCYLCNNHKSDLISEEDHKHYFAPAIRQYLEDKFLKHGKEY